MPATNALLAFGCGSRPPRMRRATRSTAFRPIPLARGLPISSLSVFAGGATLGTHDFIL